MVTRPWPMTWRSTRARDDHEGGLESADVDGPGFSALMDELAETLRDHVQDEEAEQFPELREAIPRDEMVALADKVRTAKQAAPTRPHPSAPNSGCFTNPSGRASA